MEFYDVPAYWDDQRLIEIHRDDRCREVSVNIETCMEELAMTLGLDWHRINGLVLPPEMTPSSHPPLQHFAPVRRDTPYSV